METYIKVFPIDTNQRMKSALAALRIPKAVIVQVYWMPTNDLARYWYLPAKKELQVVTRLPNGTKTKAVKILWEKVGEGYANEGIIAKKFKIAAKEGARYGYLSISSMNVGGEEAPLAFLNVTANRAAESKKGGYTDLEAVGFYATRSSREGDHFASRKPAYKGIKITAGFDSYQIHHDKPFNKTFVDRREMLASVKAHGFTEDQFFADVEKHPLDAQFDPREKATTVESIKAAVDQIVKNNEYLAKKYGTGTKA